MPPPIIPRMPELPEVEVTRRGIDEPLGTITSGGTHHAEVRALLLKYYGTDQDPALREPLHTVTTKDRFAVVTVHGEDYFIADIGMRMLQPRELYTAQGFPASYVIDRGHDGIGRPHDVRRGRGRHHRAAVEALADLADDLIDAGDQFVGTGAQDLQHGLVEPGQAPPGRELGRHQRIEQFRSPRRCRTGKHEASRHQEPWQAGNSVQASTA